MSKKYNLGQKVCVAFLARLKQILLLLLGCAPSSYAQQMIFPSDEWVRSTPESQLVDSVLLDEAVDYLDGVLPSGIGTDTLIIERNGRVIWEGQNISSLYDMASVTKSVTTTVLGLAIDDGSLTLDTLVGDFFPSIAQAVYLFCL